MSDYAVDSLGLKGSKKLPNALRSKGKECDVGSDGLPSVETQTERVEIPIMGAGRTKDFLIKAGRSA